MICVPYTDPQNIFNLVNEEFYLDTISTIIIGVKFLFLF